MDIDSRTRRALEWERLRGFLAAECTCACSRVLSLNLEPHSEKKLISMLLRQTWEALSFLAAGFSLSQDGLPDLTDVLGRLKTSAQLSSSELLDLRRSLLLAKRARTQLMQLSPDDFEHLVAFIPELHPQERLVQLIDDVFDDAGNIRDSASPLLQKLRREVSRLNNQTRDELQRLINSSALSKSLQEPIFTQRNGRYVLPVQASMRQNVQGIVHDSSASGLTVYVEPMSVVELTNKVRMKEGDIDREIDRLLMELSAFAHNVVDEISTSFNTLVNLDFISARARLAQKYKGTLPHLSEDGATCLRKARHPLLVLQNLSKASSVVANDIVLGDSIRTLVITGPNTGGKTVYLKTAGLLALMARAGLLLPVESGSAVRIFDRVFADIGDEQSIEQSLSTFSSHMTNIIDIIRQCDDSTMVLLDEVGAGTDPREGAILARVILEQLNNSGACTISTTHYGELKTLAYTQSGFSNGSFAFDDTTLSPTYHMRIGVPGSSKAITIASRLGLPESLVRAAEKNLSAEHSDIQEMIEQLEDRLAQADHLKKELEQRKDKLVQDEASLQAALRDVDSQKEKLRVGLASRMEQELSQANNLVKSLIAELQKAPSIAKAQQVQKDLKVLRDELGWLEPAAYKEQQEAFQVGETVLLKSLNQRVVIESLPTDTKADGELQVAVRSGSMKMKVSLSDLQRIQGTAKPARFGKQATPKIDHRVAGFKSTAVSSGHAQNTTRASSSSDSGLEVFVRTSRNTLDLRGQRVDEALANLESFVDSAYLERMSPLMVIHGHGTGRVKAAVREFLDASDYDVKWRAGENYEGGDGVTVVSFR